MPNGILTIPNLLSLFRIAGAPLLIGAAAAGSAALFFTLLALMFLSDAVDGYLARKWGQTSAIGARLDSIGDIVTYLSVPLAAWLLWPDRIAREAGVIAFAVSVYVLPAFFSLVKFHRLVSYHTLLTKASAVLMSLGVLLFLAFDSLWLFYTATAFLLLEAAENIAITLLLKAPRSDIRSYWELRKSGGGAQSVKKR